MRLRTDDWWTAGRKRAVMKGARLHPLREDPGANWHQPYLDQLADPTFEAAQPGDVWRIFWGKPEGEELPLAGYVLTCPNLSCADGAHAWTTASNCPAAQGERCAHYGIGSCWTWTGSPEAGDLSASPSLYCTLPLGCGWHGWLRNGEMSPA